MPVTVWIACLLAANYELTGRIVPEAEASIYLHGATTPFENATLSDSRGHFRFRKLAQGTYIVTAFQPTLGEARQTVEIGPGVTDARGHVDVTLHLDGSSGASGAIVSTRELSIPAKARREYEEAQKKLALPDVPSAIGHLERAVEIAPQYSAAWNHLGTIAYQTRRYSEAEGYFRKALTADPQSFEALVNLGGVLLNLAKYDEALAYNQHAVLRRPNDALANSQLGMSYLAKGDLAPAEKYLAAAKTLDPAHFSHPQLLLAEIHIRKNEHAAAAAELRDFLKRHPDAPEAAHVKERLSRLQ
jgi:Tfp pilus assembly protein PilF